MKNQRPKQPFIYHFIMAIFACIMVGFYVMAVVLLLKFGGVVGSFILGILLVIFGVGFIGGLKKVKCAYCGKPVMLKDTCGKHWGMPIKKRVCEKCYIFIEKNALKMV